MKVTEKTLCATARIDIKKRALDSMKAAEFLKLVSLKGFFVRSSPGDIFIIPGRYAVATTVSSTNESHGLC